MIMNTRLRISSFFAAAAAVAVGLACATAAVPAAATGVATVQTRPDRATQLLFDAVHSNDFAAAEAAVAAGANVEARDRWDTSAIEVAIDKGYFRIAHFLVSVRNSRTPAGDTASQGRTQPAQAVAPTPPTAAAAIRRAAPVQPPAQPAGSMAVTQPVWPADKPNPFDPATPAFGTALPVIPPAQATAADAATPDDGPMLATDEPAQHADGLR